jgi:hypothetical protein
MSRALDREIAEELGWKNLRYHVADVVSGSVLIGYNPRSTYAWCIVPYWSRDNAASWSLAGHLADDEKMLFVEALSALCGVDPEEIYWDAHWAITPIHGTPVQRCRAFLQAKEQARLRLTESA